MCAYKLCKVEFRYWGMQSKIERFIHDVALRKTMLKAHSQVNMHHMNGHVCILFLFLLSHWIWHQMSNSKQNSISEFIFTAKRHLLGQFLRLIQYFNASM